MFQLTIIRAEGVPDNIEILIFIEGKLVSPIPKRSELTYYIPNKCQLRILVKNKQTKLSVCSASIKTEILPLEGFQWLPLSSSPSDLYTFIPENVSLPRILILLSSGLLSPIVELSEGESEENDSILSEVQRFKIEPNMQISDFKSIINSITSENEKNKFLANKFKTLYSECKQEMEDFKHKYEEEKKITLDLINKVKTMTDEQNEIKANAKMREEFLESLINEREKHYKNLGIESLRDSSNFERILETRPKTEIRKSLSRNSLNINLQKENFDTKKYHSQRKTGSENTPVCTNKTINEALKDFMKKNKRQGLFKFDNGNTYKYGNKKVLISMKNNKLLCRVGGGFENIEDFVAKNPENKSASPLQGSHRRANTINSAKSQREPIIVKADRFSGSLAESEDFFNKKYMLKYFMTE